MYSSVVVITIVYVQRNHSDYSTCSEHDGRQRAGFKRRAQLVFIVKDHRRRQVAGSRGRQKVIQGNSTGREKASNVIREIRQ